MKGSSYGMDAPSVTLARECDGGLIFYRSLSVPLHGYPLSLPHSSSTVQLNLPLTGLFFHKAFPVEEVTVSFITLFFLRFSYDLILIYLDDLISHRDSSLINHNILLTVSC